MPTFRVCDVVVALPRTGGAAPAEAVGAPGAPGEPGGEPGAAAGVTGCIGGTQAIYACLNGPSVNPDCVPSDPVTHMIVGPCYGPSVVITCVPSDPVTHRAMMACHHPSVVPTCVPSDPVTRNQIQMCLHPSVVPTCVPSDPVTRRAVVGAMSADELEILKRQLAEAIEQVERQEERLRDAQGGEARPPETLAEVDKLEHKFKEALEYLKTRRSELKNAARAGDKARE